MQAGTATKFIFDLDGTVTREETLPIIAEHFNIREEMDNLTENSVKGNIPFVESFIRRVHLLSNIPYTEIDDLLEKIPLHTRVVEFIQEHRENCCVVTGNLSCWVNKLLLKVGCVAYTSEASIEDDKVSKLISILKKENVVERYRHEGNRVVYVGDGNNDVEAMREADVSIASGMIHMPTVGVLSVADYLVFDEGALCRQLNQLL